MNMIVFVLFALAILVFSLLVNDFLLKFLKNLGTKSTNGDIRWNSNRKPAIGGISFFICFLIATISMFYTIQGNDHFPMLEFYGLMFALSIGFINGLFDDAYHTIPWLKLSLQIICGIVLTSTGTSIEFFDSQIANHILTVLWVVGIMNAVNLLDNMDGISTIVTFFIILSFLLSIFILKNSEDHYFLILLGMAVSLLAFLKYNWYPSKMYMGDTGSMFLGVFIAAFGIIYLWNFKTNDGLIAPLSARFATVALVFALPLIDTTTVFIKRLLINRKSPFKGGKDHTTHHLSYLGLNDREVALTFTALSLFNILLGVLVLQNANRWNSFYILAFGSWFALEFAVLFVVANLNTSRNEVK
jgi:UDP-GlcNAc:undecaprenyl-phosphate/decaprenyl-phosphate GlcNAc-1-phosphate transferase